MRQKASAEPARRRRGVPKVIFENFMMVEVYMSV
jgi:hypothetical protein